MGTNGRCHARLVYQNGNTTGVSFDADDVDSGQACRVKAKYRVGTMDACGKHLTHLVERASEDYMNNTVPIEIL